MADPGCDDGSRAITAPPLMPLVEPLLLAGVVVVWRNYYLLLRFLLWDVCGSGMANPSPACRVPVISMIRMTNS
jgi:hypothetical protein